MADTIYEERMVKDSAPPLCEPSCIKININRYDVLMRHQCELDFSLFTTNMNLISHPRELYHYYLHSVNL